MVLISFIIPAYNAAPYLENCLSSIYQLDMGTYEREVIVVNDGSTDDTALVLERIKAEHPEMKVSSQANQGQSVARNVGMQMATGKYIYFVDADDALDINGASSFPFECLEKEDIDLYGVNLNVVGAKGLRPYRRYQPLCNYVFRPARSFMKGRNLQPCPCAYLYRRDFLVTKGLRFHEGIFHEDEEWASMVFAQAESFVALNVNFYLRYIRKESTTTTTNRSKQELKLHNMLTVIRTLDNYMNEHPEIRPYMSCKVNYLCVDVLRLLRRQHHTRDFSREVVGELQKMGYFPLRKQPGWKYRTFRILTKCIY